MTLDEVINYLLNACDIETKELKNIIDYFNGGDAVMTTAEKLISQDKIDGKIEGIGAILEIKFGDQIWR